MAVIAALEKAVSMGIEEVKMLADSQLIVRQLNGQYKVKNEKLKPLYQKVVDLKKTFKKFSIDYIPREMNKEADQLTNGKVKHGGI